MVALALVPACGSERAPAPRQGPPAARQPPHVPDSARCVLSRPDRRSGRAARAELLRDLDRYVRGRPGRVVYSAHELVGGVSLGRGEHRNDMITASGSKVDILLALLLRREKLDEEERDLAARMITESDNSAADSLWWRVGAGDAMSGFYRRAGLRETTPGPGKYWGGTKTSPADRIRLLRLLVDGGGKVRAADRALVLGLMGRVVKDQAWGVSAAARPGDRVALKNGWVAQPFIHNTWAVTSYGRVKGPGRDLLLSVQTDQQPGEGTGIQTIEGVARMIGTRLDSLSPLRVRACSARPTV